MKWAWTACWRICWSFYIYWLPNGRIPMHMFSSTTNFVTKMLWIKDFLTSKIVNLVKKWAHNLTDGIWIFDLEKEWIIHAFVYVPVSFNWAWLVLNFIPNIQAQVVLSLSSKRGLNPSLLRAPLLFSVVPPLWNIIQVWTLFLMKIDLTLPFLNQKLQEIQVPWWCLRCLQADWYRHWPIHWL